MAKREKDGRSYIELLRDPRWQKKAADIKTRDGWQCQNCSSTTKNLQVDHRYYERGRMPWEYPDAALWTLCGDCHLEATELRRAIAKEIGNLTPALLLRVLGYAVAQVAMESTDGALIEIAGLEHTQGILDATRLLPLTRTEEGLRSIMVVGRDISRKVVAARGAAAVREPFSDDEATP